MNRSLRTVDKTENLKPFQKGQSGNPHGRPKIPAEIREIARAASPDALQALMDVMKDSKAPHAARVSAADKILDRAWGKAAQPIDGDGRGGAMELVHRRARHRQPSQPEPAMKASNETRLRRIEADRGSRDTRLFVIEGATKAERDAYIRGLISSGEARESDTFIHTGVPRNGSHIDHGPVPDLMDRIAAQGRKIHDPMD
jgi:hypothetical protein